MKILAIETATRAVGCALWADGGPLASFLLVAGPRHAEVLMPAIDEMFRRAGLSVAELDAVAVDVGPGLFTGLRVGLASAAAIAMARRLPSVGVTSLDALVRPHRRRPGLVAAIVDARRSEVYWALYQSDGSEIKQLQAPAVAGPQDVANELASLAERPLAVGDGAWRYREPLGDAGAEIGDRAEMWPSPLMVAEIGAEQLGEEHRGQPEAGSPAFGASPPAPLYLRQADVRIGWDEVGGRVGPGSSARARGFAQAAPPAGAGGEAPAARLGP